MHIFLLRGTRTVRIKTFTDHEHQCNNCRDFDLKVRVYKDYFHFLFIPIYATGVKTVKIRCNKCGEPYRSDSLNKQYEKRTRIPFYLYSGVLLVVLVALGAFGNELVNRYLNRSYASNPRVGDVYTVRPPHGFGQFYKVARVNGDSVLTYNSHAQYIFESASLDSTDYFVGDREVPFMKGDLREMLDSGVITNVSRHYDESSGFNRVK